MRDATFTDVHLKTCVSGNWPLYLQLAGDCKIRNIFIPVRWIRLKWYLCPSIGHWYPISDRWEPKIWCCGVYNMDFEIIKKQVDKGLSKVLRIDCGKRRAPVGGLYARKSKGQEYQEYFNYLIKTIIWEPAVEHFEIEKLQDVEGCGL